MQGCKWIFSLAKPSSKLIAWLMYGPEGMVDYFYPGICQVSTGCYGYKINATFFTPNEPTLAFHITLTQHCTVKSCKYIKYFPTHGKKLN